MLKYNATICFGDCNFIEFFISHKRALVLKVTFVFLKAKVMKEGRTVVIIQSFLYETAFWESLFTFWPQFKITSKLAKIRFFKCLIISKKYFSRWQYCWEKIKRLTGFQIGAITLSVSYNHKKIVICMFRFYWS